jgi:hypothetical protein
MATFLRTFHHYGKICPAGEGGGGAHHPPFTLSTITNKVVMYAPAERADTYTPPPYFSSTPTCICTVLCGRDLLYRRDTLSSLNRDFSNSLFLKTPAFCCFFIFSRVLLFCDFVPCSRQKPTTGKQLPSRGRQRGRKREG